MQTSPHATRMVGWLLPCLVALTGCTVLVNNELDSKPARPSDDPQDGATELEDANVDGDVGHSDSAAGTHDAGADASANPQDGSTSASNAGYRIVMGGAHGCGLAPDGVATCWGDNTDGQLNLPAQTYRDISAGEGHTCGITTAGALVCVGRNTRAQRASAPGPFVAVAAGDLHTCALASSGQVTCFGDNTEGQTSPPADVKFEKIVAGRAFSCGLEKDSGHLRCWGRGKTTFENNAGSLALREVVAGTGVLCAIEDKNGKAICWGASQFAAPDLDPVTSITVGLEPCAVLESGTLTCWGDTQPLVFEDGTGPYLSVAAGGDAVCAIPAQGSLVCKSYGDVSSAAPPAAYP